jgi:hypothetical protein
LAIFQTSEEINSANYSGELFESWKLEFFVIMTYSNMVAAIAIL